MLAAAAGVKTASRGDFWCCASRGANIGLPREESRASARVHVLRPAPAPSSHLNLNSCCQVVKFVETSSWRRYFFLLTRSLCPQSSKMSLLLIILSLLLPAIVSAVFLPKLLRFGAELLGHHLRRSSRTRRELLLARVASETKTHEAEQKNRRKEDNDWEEVGNTAAGSKVGSGKADSEWDGIVGSFHPFWYA